MRLADLPQLTIEAVGAERCLATFEPSRWMGEGWVGFLYVDGRFIEGRFVEVDADRRRCAFVPDDPTTLATLSPGAAHPYFEGYWGQRAELVLGAGRLWQRRRFVAEDAVEFPSESGRLVRPMSDQGSARLYRPDSSRSDIEGGRVRPGGWDHEHCAICWESIDADTSEAFFSEPRDWVCVACYGAFVVPRSLDFINPEGLERGPS